MICKTIDHWHCHSHTHKQTPLLWFKSLFLATRTLTHSVLHGKCYLGQRATGNSVYHFLTVTVCLCLHHMIGLHENSLVYVLCINKKKTECEGGAHRNCYHTLHMFCSMKTCSIRRWQICLLVSLKLGFLMSGISTSQFHFCLSKWALKRWAVAGSFHNNDRATAAWVHTHSTCTVQKETCWLGWVYRFDYIV